MASCFAFSVPFFAKSKKKKKLQNDFTNAKKNNLKEKNQKGIGINLRFWGQNAKKKKETQVEISKAQVIEDKLNRGFGETCNAKSPALSTPVKEVLIKVPNYEKEPAIESYVGLMQDELEQGVPEQFSSLSPRVSSPFEQAHIEGKADQDDLFSCLSSFSDVELDLDDEDFDAYSCFSSFSQEHLIDEFVERVDKGPNRELHVKDKVQEIGIRENELSSPLNKGHMEEEVDKTLGKRFDMSHHVAPSEEPVGAGLVNMGNSCYINAVLQCLTHTSLLAEAISSTHHSCCKIDRFCTFCALKEHIKGSREESGSTFWPVEFVQNIQEFSSDLIPGQQNDAHEFLGGLIMKLCDINHIFGGYLRSQLTCGVCAHKSDTLEPFYHLSIELDNCTKTLQNAIKSFTKVENLKDGGVMCQGCQVRVSKMEKQILIDKPPQILIVNFKRFTNNRKKINKFIPYSMEFDLAAVSEENATKYELYAVIEHKGSFEAGHYISIIKTSNSGWHVYNDEHVTPILAQEALNKCAYILFYRKKGSPP